MRSLGIYVHIPYCAKKCAYCDFYSVPSRESSKAYCSALIKQIESYGKKATGYIVDTIYIGGGTPSYIDAEDIFDVIGAIRRTFNVDKNAEISMEANPGTLDGDKLAVYRSAGINRLSLGLQSAHNDELKTLSRIHTYEDFESSFLLARLEGFDNINVDIMYALPEQTPEKLAETIETVTALSPEHISFYGLKIEENTPFAYNKAISESLPDEETQYKMYMDSAKTLEERGYRQYEISNFAKDGYACRHNMKYWKCNDYLGFGAAAASFFEGRLFSQVKNIDYFIEDPLSVFLIDSTEEITPKKFETQYVMLGFRLSEGISLGEYRLRCGGDFIAKYGERLKPFLEKKLVVKTSGGFKLSRRGMLVSNYILSEILDFDED